MPERQRCICADDVCLGHCRACNHSGRDLEEPCIADPDWTPDEDDLARRETTPPAAEQQHHPDCPVNHFADKPERCRCVFMAMLDKGGQA